MCRRAEGWAGLREVRVVSPVPSWQARQARPVPPGATRVNLTEGSSRVEQRGLADRHGAEWFPPAVPSIGRCGRQLYVFIGRARPLEVPGWVRCHAGAAGSRDVLVSVTASATHSRNDAQFRYRTAVWLRRRRPSLCSLPCRAPPLQSPFRKIYGGLMTRPRALGGEGERTEDGLRTPIRGCLTLERVAQPILCKLQSLRRSSS